LPRQNPGRRREAQRRRIAIGNSSSDSLSPPLCWRLCTGEGLHPGVFRAHSFKCLSVGFARFEIPSIIPCADWPRPRTTNPEAFQRTPETFLRAPETFRLAPEAFLLAPEAFLRAPEAFRRAPEAFRRATEAFQRTPEAFRRATEAFQRVPEAFRRAPEAFRRALKGSQPIQSERFVFQARNENRFDGPVLKLGRSRSSPNHENVLSEWGNGSRPVIHLNLHPRNII